MISVENSQQINKNILELETVQLVIVIVLTKKYRTTNLLSSRWPDPPPELQPTQCQDSARKSSMHLGNFQQIMTP